MFGGTEMDALLLDFGEGAESEAERTRELKPSIEKRMTVHC